MPLEGSSGDGDHDDHDGAGLGRDGSKLSPWAFREVVGFGGLGGFGSFGVWGCLGVLDLGSWGFEFVFFFLVLGF